MSRKYYYFIIIASKTKPGVYDGSRCELSLTCYCFQPTLSTWFKWNDEMPGPSGRMSGSVCGQDPRYCKSPASTGAFEWKDDISKWPVNVRNSGLKLNYNYGNKWIHIVIDLQCV